MDSERIWKIVDTHRSGVKKRASGTALSLSDCLHDMYVDLLPSNNDKIADKRFRSAVNLLARLEKVHARPSLIVNLYEDEKGYSIMLCLAEGGETDEIFMPYEDNEIFNYLDNQELPPVVMEVLGHSKFCHLYNGCVVAEVRDYRCHSVLAGYDKHLLLLRPTTETILAMVNELAHQTKSSHEEKLYLEACVLLATQPPLCLETTTDVLCVTNRLHYNQRKFHSPGIRRYLRRRCHAARALMQLAAEEKPPERLRLNDFINRKRSHGRNFSNNWKRPKLSLDPKQININAVAKVVAELAKPVPVPRIDLSLLSPDLPASQVTPSQPTHVTPPSQSTPLTPSHPLPPPRPPPPPHRPPVVQPTIADELLKGDATQRPPIIQQPPPRPLPQATPPTHYAPPPSQPSNQITVVPVPRPVPRSPLTPPQMRSLAPKDSTRTGQTMGSLQARPPPRQHVPATPPKLTPSPKHTIVSTTKSKAIAATGMPKLRPLTPESPLKLKPIPPSSTPHVHAKSSTRPAMPQLHKMSTMGSGAPSIIAKLGMPSLKPVTHPHSTPHATPLTASQSTPSPLSMSVVRNPTHPVARLEPPRKMADTRMPPSLSSLGTTHKSPQVKHARSRSGKLISGSKAKGRKKK